MTNREKKNDRVGLGVSIGIHAALLLLFVFLLAWKEPIPPIPEYGIMLNFGLDDAGFGEVQPTTPANDNPDLVEDPAPEEPATSEEVSPEPEVTSEPQEAVVEEVVESTPTESAPQNVTTQPDPSPTVVEEKPKETPKKPEPKKEEPKLNPAANYPGKTNTSDGASGTTGSNNSPSQSNQGDKPGETGDQGDPDGSVDSRALYGSSGGGGGASLSMSGWNWDYLPKPRDNSNESGRIVFEIKIDEDGEIISVRTIEKTVSDAVVKVYRAEVAKLTFSPTSGNSRPAPTSTGRITFTIRSK
jgi:outer membrane biosynthesis protein TonB